jgi:hypothetical protein
MFSLYSNSKFAELTEYIPFNQLYYVFYKQKLESSRLKYILLKFFKYFIRTTKRKQKFINRIVLHKKYKNNLNSRILEKFDFFSLITNLNYYLSSISEKIDGDSTFNSYLTPSGIKYKTYLIRLIIIVEMLLIKLNIFVIPSLSSFPKFLSQTKDLDESYQVKYYKNIKHFYSKSKKELREFTAFLKKIKKNYFKLSKKYDKLFTNSEIAFEGEWIKTLYLESNNNKKAIKIILLPKYNIYNCEMQDYSLYQYPLKDEGRNFSSYYEGQSTSKKIENLLELNGNYRISIDKKELKSIIDELKRESNLSLQQISKKIGCNVKNYLYGYSNSLSVKSFIQLRSLIGREIKYNIFEAFKVVEKLNQNERLAEFVTIMLGDGNLYEKLYRIQISFNGEEEKRYINYVKGLMKRIFGITPKEYWEKEKKGAIGKEKNMYLYINNKSAFYELISNGLVAGNKVKHQVSVPKWILENQNFMIGGLRGLFDTDGSISVLKNRSSLLIDFTSASLPLVRCFKEMCEEMTIKPNPKITRRVWKNPSSGNVSTSYKVIIGSKHEICKFLYMIKPKKWEYKWREIKKKIENLGNSLEDVLKYRNESLSNLFAEKVLKELY